MTLATHPRTALAEWLYRFRVHLNLTQREMAEDLGTTLQNYQRWEYGASQPSGSAWKLLYLLAVDFHDFDEPPEIDTSRPPRPREES
jgi:DNA-binding transcriptional regulator YiaG